MWQSNTFIDDNSYSNFSLRGKRYHARKREQEEAKNKAGAYDVLMQEKAEQDKKDAEAKAKAEMDAKTEEEAKKLIAQQGLQNNPAPVKSYKIPLIIGGVAILGIVTIFLIKKLNK